MLVAAAAATLPSLLFYLFNRVYILEAALLMLLALLPVARAACTHRPVAGWIGVAAILALAARPALRDDYRENVPYQAMRQTEGRALAARGAGATAVWAPEDDPGPCRLAALILAYDDGAALLPERPPDGEALADCLVVRR